MKRGVYWDWNLTNYKNTVDALVYELTNKKAYQVFDICVAISPIDSGAYRASWTIQEGSPANYFIGRQPRGLPPLNKPSRPRLSTLFYRKLYVSNGSPYAQRIEDGWSNQAPAGVMSVAVNIASAL